MVWPVTLSLIIPSSKYHLFFVAGLAELNALEEKPFAPTLFPLIIDFTLVYSVR